MAKASGFPAEFQRHGHVFQRRHRWNQLERLEDNAYFLTTEPRERVFRKGAEVAAVDADGAGIGAFQTGESHEQRRFSRAGRPKQTDRFPRRHAQADALENMDPRGAFAQRQVDVG